jgi:hypothetical protein
MKILELKVGQRVKYKNDQMSARPNVDTAEGVPNEYTILAVSESGIGYIYPLGNPRGVGGDTYKGFAWAVQPKQVELIPEKYEIEYDEPLEDEMDDDCVEGCLPGEHKCDKKVLVTIRLIQIGRSKANEDIQVARKGRTEQQLAELALEKCKNYLASNDVELYPDEKKGAGFWKVRVGMGYHVGDVEII